MHRALQCRDETKVREEQDGNAVHFILYRISNPLSERSCVLEEYNDAESGKKRSKRLFIQHDYNTKTFVAEGNQVRRGATRVVVVDRQQEAEVVLRFETGPAYRPKQALIPAHSHVYSRGLTMVCATPNHGNIRLDKLNPPSRNATNVPLL